MINNTVSPPRKSHGTNAGAATSAAHDKQFRVESDVKVAVVQGHSVWLAHVDGSISIRRVRTAEAVHVIPASQQRGRPWAMLPVVIDGGRPTMWIGYSTGDLEVLDAETRTPLKLVCRHTGGIYCLSEFGGSVFTGSNDFQIVQWRARDVSFVRQLTGHSNYVRALHAEGSVVVSASDDYTVRVWNATNGQLISIGRFHRSGVSALCRVGPCMWSGDDKGGIVVWRLQTLEQEEVLSEHMGRINALRKVGSRIYSASADHSIGVWDAVGRCLVARIDDHRGWVAMVLAPAQLTRYYLWSAAADSTVRCWHHDEYKVVTGDVERFNDVQWYNAEYNPYHELNEELAQQVTRLEEKSEHLLQAYTADHAHIEDCTTQVQIMRDATQRAEDSEAAAKDVQRECETRLVNLVDANTRKEKELTELAEQSKTLRSENVDLRCRSETLKTENEELRRQLELAVSARDKLDTALKETLALRTAKGDITPIIVTTSGEAADQLSKTQQELRESLMLNETLRDDIARMSRAVAAATTSTVASANSDYRRRQPRASDGGHFAKRLDVPGGGAPLDGLFAASSGSFSARRPSGPGQSGGAAARRMSASGTDSRLATRSYVMDRYTK